METGFNLVIEKVLREKRTYLLEHESKEVLKAYNLTTTECYVVKELEEAKKLAKEIGYPVVLKVLSPQVIHKSDLGGVKLNLKNEEELSLAFEELWSKFKDQELLGLSLQKMAVPGIEVIVGVSTDPTFGSVIMFGLGGIFVEILKEVSFRVLPLTERDAMEMIEETKGYQLLKGYRGVSGDIKSLKQVLLKVSQLIEENPIIKEMDLNPIFIYPEGYTIVDARIVLDPSLYKEPSKLETPPLDNLKGLLYPESIAVVGASNVKGKLGWNVFYNLLTHGYRGRLYPVNPKAKEVQGIKAYRSISEIPDKIDTAIVLVPAFQTPQVVDECCKAGVKYVIIESAGFGELGEEGKVIEAELKKIIQKYGVRLLGPNCSGIINTHCGVVESIGVVEELGIGNVGLIAQAGVYSAGYLWGLRKVLDFGIIATIGNQLDLNETDLLFALGEDENIKVICMYLENIKGGRRFLEVAQKVTSKKPVIVLKTGRTEEGKRAALSHTASLAGSDEIYSAVFKQTGIIRAKNNDHMFALARAFSKQPFPTTDGVFIISYAGSLGVAAADAVALNGLRLAQLSEELKRELKEVLPEYVSTYNPVDFTFTQTSEQVKKTIEIAKKSPEVGSFVVIVQTEKLNSYIEPLKEIDFEGRPIVVVCAVKEFVMDWVIQMEKVGIPVYSTPEEAVEVLATMYYYSQKILASK
ncbi:MAG: acetate--CoA ligase family protein [Thermodesulfobacterium sp.]|nr:acetate--CoA ligase family protein [Thermodesulfobacterium sp.]